MALSGVRSSWVTAVRKRVLAAFSRSAVPARSSSAASAAVRAATVRDWARMRSVPSGAGNAERSVSIATIPSRPASACGACMRSSTRAVGRALADRVDRLHEGQPVGDVDLPEEAASDRPVQPVAAGLDAVRLEDVALQVVQRYQARQAGQRHGRVACCRSRRGPGAAGVAALHGDGEFRQEIGGGKAERQAGGEERGLARGGRQRGCGGQPAGGRGGGEAGGEPAPAPARDDGAERQQAGPARKRREQAAARRGEPGDRDGGEPERRRAGGGAAAGPAQHGGGDQRQRGAGGAAGKRHHRREGGQEKERKQKEQDQPGKEHPAEIADMARALLLHHDARVDPAGEYRVGTRQHRQNGRARSTHRRSRA